MDGYTKSDYTFAPSTFELVSHSARQNHDKRLRCRAGGSNCSFLHDSFQYGNLKQVTFMILQMRVARICLDIGRSKNE
jgi:hypothetical protein